MVATLITRTAFWLTGMAALLFLPAGTLAWPAGWAFIALMAATSVATGLWLARHDPALLAERLAPPVQIGQQGWDKLLIALVMGLFCAWLVVMALDAVRYRYSHVALPLQVAGASAIGACMYLAFLTFRANTFAAPVVRVQHERGQRVIDTGPYAVVRHPMYAGAMLYFVGVPLLLGSWIGLAFAPLLTGLLALRVVLEERTLEAGLPGYADYTARVPWRLVPGVW